MTNITRIVGRKRYSTKTATLIASDAYWDSHNWERSGRNMFLYRTPKDAFFLVTLTQAQNERDSLEPVTADKAIRLYDSVLGQHAVSWEEAFPGVTIEDA